MIEPPSLCAPVSIKLRAAGGCNANISTVASVAALNIAVEGLGAARASKCSVECRQSAVPETAAVFDPHKRAEPSANIANYLAAGIIDPHGAADSNIKFAANVGVAKFGVTNVEHYDGDRSTAISFAGGWNCRIAALLNNHVLLGWDRWMPIYPWKE